MYLGKISYGLYLYHVIVIEIFNNLQSSLGERHVWWLQLATITLSIVAAVVSWEFVERPILELKDKFSYMTVERVLNIEQGSNVDMVELTRLR